MYIRQLHIRDFGIFHNQTLDELPPSLVVIGGHNRAGKTTLLQVLRYLGFGFHRGRNLPPARDKREVEGKVILDNDEVYHLKVRGFAEPAVNCLQGQESIGSAEEIYDVDRFTYHRLFTLTLDELQKLPSGVDSDDREKLQSILIGAGLSEVLQLPSIEEEFKKQANKIGGKNGTTNVKEFKPFYRQIKQGLKLRQEANDQLEEYRQAERQLQKVEGEIEESQRKLTGLEALRDRLDVLKNNFEDYSRYRELTGKLAEPGVSSLLQDFPGDRIERVENLYQDFQQDYRNYRELAAGFADETGCEPSEQLLALKQRLLNRGDRITGFYNQLSGLRERIKNFQQNRENHRQNSEELLLKARNINRKWDSPEDFAAIKELETDLGAQEHLNQLVVDYRQNGEQLQNLETEVAELQQRLDEKEEGYRQLETPGPGRDLRRYLYLSLGVIGGSVLLVFVNVWLSLVVGMAGIGGTLLYMISRRDYLTSSWQQQTRLEQEIEEIKNKLASKEETLDNLQQRQQQLRERLNSYADQLGLSREAHPELIKEYWREVRDLKQGILDHERQARYLRSTRRELEEQLTELRDFIKEFRPVTPGDSGLHGSGTGSTDGLELSLDLAPLARGIRNLYEYLDQARQLERVRQQLQDYARRLGELLPASELQKVATERSKLKVKLEQEVLASGEKVRLVDDSSGEKPGKGSFEMSATGFRERVEHFLERGQRFQEYRQLKQEFENLKTSLLNSLSTDRIRKALGKLEDNGPADTSSDLLDLFDRLYNQYLSREDVETAYEDCNRQLKDFERELESLKDKRQTLKDKLERLATSDKLEQAQQQIDDNRAELRKKAREYALNRAAAFIVNRVKKRFMEQTKDELFNGASQALARITGGEYRQILPPDNLVEPDFKAVLGDDTIQETTEVLSRGTREQLFLAIRLSRIQKIQPPLPVIIDDTLVNFDNYHLDQALGLLKELTTTHQVFILTCHPEFIRLLAEKGPEADYWQLEQGSFSRSNSQQLIDHLTT